MRPPIPSINLSRRAKIAIGVAGTLIVLLILASSLVGVYVDWLWFGEVGFRDVYRSILSTRVVLFLVFGLTMALAIGANLVAAYVRRPPFRPLSPEQQNLERYRVMVEPRKRLAVAGLMVLAGVSAGLAAQSNWKPWMLWRYGGSFGQRDEQFHKDISFFAWDYPVYRIVLGFALSAVIFSLVLSIGVHYLFGAIRLQTPGPKITISARRHLTVLVFLFIVLKAISYWLDRYGLVFSDRSKVTGASYTDVNASLPAKTILFWIAVIIAVGVLASLWLRSAVLPGIGFAVLLIISILINGIYPALVQQFSVKPNASSKEAKYIQRNINATRAAYNIGTIDTSNADAATDYTAPTVTYSDYKTTDTPAFTALAPSDPTVSNIRILDPNVVSPTFLNKQQLGNVFGFPAKLDVDRYTFGGKTSDYIVAVRELNASGLQNDQTNWINKHTVFTHGYGFTAAAADSDITAQNAGFTEGDIPPAGPLDIKEPNVYYGELASDYAIVGAQGSPQEFDPSSQSKKSTYAGSGGVSLSSVFTRLAFAVNYKETNFLLNSAVGAQGAKVMYVRDPRDRVLKVAPFLKVDGDPYPAVIDGRIIWMIDGYTTMSNYPYSQVNSLSDLTSDSLSKANRTAAQPDDNINYIRNSVKATVDAYDGTIKLYQWDDKDPVLRAWMRAFPKLVEPRTAMPAPVLEHIRYPQDLFEVQRSVLQQYHVDNPVTFYNASDRWTVPADPYAVTSANQPPYYVLADSPAQAGNSAQFQLTSPMTFNSRPNLAAFLTVDSDPGDGYGKLTVLSLPGSSNIDGPQQVANKFKTDATISKDISLLDSGGSAVVHGNLLTLPIGNSFLYVEPLYVTSGSGFPTLQRVIVAYGQGLGYGANLKDALANLSQGPVGRSLVVGQTTTGSSSPTPTVTPSPGTSSVPPSGGSSSPAPPANLQAALDQLDQATQALQTAFRSGDPVAIGNAEKALIDAAAAVQRARAPSSAPPASSAPPTPTPSPS